MTETKTDKWEEFASYLADHLSSTLANAGSPDFILKTEGNRAYYVDVEGNEVWIIKVEPLID
jgi:hypothetical protein